MNTLNSKGLEKRKRPSIFRTALIAVALLPSWHVLGIFLSHVPESQAHEIPSASGRFALLPYPSIPLHFQATAYCINGITKSGIPAQPGIVAGDPTVLPIGTWIRMEAPNYGGIYQVMDTGRLIKGRIIDVFIPGYDRAIEFGRQQVKVTVLKYAPFRRRATLLSD